jgi:hypothetical protein
MKKHAFSGGSYEQVRDCLWRQVRVLIAPSISLEVSYWGREAYFLANSKE